jgi:hypothetical protein
VTETGLLIAEGVFLLLLYLFIWWVVRSSSREVRGAAPAAGRTDPMPAPEPSGDTSRGRAVPAPAPVGVAVAEPPVAPAPSPDELAAAAAAAAASAGRARERERDSGPIFDMTSGLRPRLVVERSPDLEPGAEHELQGGLTIGRSESSQLTVPDAFVSHMHARVFRRGQFHFIEDLGSTNGTYVNDRRIVQETQLKVHDELRMGETILRYEE